MIAVRVVVVTTLLLAALLIQFASDLEIPLEFVYATTLLTFVLSIGYIISGKLIESRAANLYLQFGGDLFIETLLVYFTGGLDSPFSFLYLVTIITASMMLYRRGGLFVASGAVILYGGLADLMYYHVVPLPPQSVFSPSPWSSARLYLNMAANFAGFYATALLTAYVSEQLRVTFRELDVNRESLARLQALSQNVIESIPSGLVTMTTEGIVAFVNPAGAAILGIEAASLVGTHVTECGIWSLAEWSAIRQRLDREGVLREESTYEHAGEMHTVGFAVTPLRSADGALYGLTLIFQDLTEMKKLEEQLRLKDRMAAVGELSAGIAHEIRNPLTAIAGSVQVLRTSTHLQPAEQRLMSIILKESERLEKSIAEFLRFVRPHERCPAEFDVASSLTETLELLANSSELKPRHEIVREIDPPSFFIVADADQIRQVFWNIARNAVHAMQEGGVLHVSTTVGREFYRITFADEGIGMSPAERKNLFQPFRTNFPSGTGLGMAISYRIVQEHGGRIEIESTPGAGTRITVALPIAPRGGTIRSVGVRVVSGD
ncbi:MAG: ATP-binding protein [Thermoanaerobaculia bacterium]